MLNFDEDSRNAQILAIHYAKKTGDDDVVNFMSSNSDIVSPDQALQVAKVFWEMTNLAIEDNGNNVAIEGILDIEFWMYKLFIKVSGYFTLNGFEAQWDQASDNYKG